METWLVFWLATTLLILALARLRLFVSLTYRRRGRDDHLAVDVYALKKIVSYRLEVPLARIARRGGLPWPETVVDTPRGRTETRSREEQRYVRTTWRIFRHHPRHWRKLTRQVRFFARLYRRTIARLLIATSCEKISWRTGLGIDDAALTSIAAGFAWQFKNHTYVYMQRRLKSVPRPVFAVQPLYARKGVDIELECIFSVRLGNVINALTTAIRFLAKGGNRQWKNTRSRV
jgi:hypothetical protein